MDKRDTNAAFKGVIALLESVRSKRESILENPYRFDEICDSLERRARFLRSILMKKRTPKSFVVRRRLYWRKGELSRGLEIVNGIPFGPKGRVVVHPNGLLWTAQETAAEIAQQKYMPDTERQH